jgi:uncharacterized protein YecT (DUF1311 family)
MRRTAWAGVGLALVWGLAVQAQDVATPGEVDCETAEAQSDLNACAGMDFSDADADLNNAYQAAVAAMQATDQGLPQDQQGAETALREAQRAWIAFRDQTCTAEGYAFHGGSLEIMIVLECKARVTAARSEDLWAMSETFDTP